MCVWGFNDVVVRTLLIDVLVGQLVLLAQEVADHGGEEVTRTARVARGVLGGTAEVVIIVVIGNVASSGRNCRGCEVVLVGTAHLGWQDWVLLASTAHASAAAIAAAWGSQCMLVQGVLVFKIRY